MAKNHFGKGGLCGAGEEWDRADSVTDLPASWMFDSVERNEAGVHLSVPRSSVYDGRHQGFGPGPALNG